MRNRTEANIGKMKTEFCFSWDLSNVLRSTDDFQQFANKNMIDDKKGKTKPRH